MLPEKKHLKIDGQPGKNTKIEFFKKRFRVKLISRNFCESGLLI